MSNYYYNRTALERRSLQTNQYDVEALGSHLDCELAYSFSRTFVGFVPLPIHAQRIFNTSLGMLYCLMGVTNRGDQIQCV